MFHDSSSWVFPHSEICGSKLICSSPQLIAACHVLHRLSMPRHSPYALLRLNYLSILDTIWFFVSRLNCCVILAVFFGKIVSFTLRKNLISLIVSDLRFLSFPLLCLSCMSHKFFRIHMISLIRFSMNVPQLSLSTCFFGK